MTLIVESIHEAVASGNFDDLETYLLVVRETAHRFGLHAQEAGCKLSGSQKDSPDEELAELMARFMALCQLQNAANALEVELAQRLTDTGRVVRLH